ncbi:MAG: biotin--[acetyl-CoA-carboxylase] ligase [Marinicella sp.]
MSGYPGLSLIEQDHPDKHISWVDSIDSTQSAVKPNSILIAEYQKAGVGRRGNSWLSASGQSICFSYRFILRTEINHMSGYALIIALATIQAMADYEVPTGKTIQAQVKWPNDLYFEDKKFAGILISLKPKGKKQLDVTVGIGINWSLSEAQMRAVNQPVCNIPLRNKPTRGAFINQLIKQINNNNEIFLQHGLKAFLSQWHAHDYLANKNILITQLNDSTAGTYCGIDDQGQLTASVNGKIKRFSGGEVSVRTI